MDEHLWCVMPVRWRYVPKIDEPLVRWILVPLLIIYLEPNRPVSLPHVMRVGVRVRRPISFRPLSWAVPYCYSTRTPPRPISYTVIRWCSGSSLQNSNRLPPLCIWCVSCMSVMVSLRLWWRVGVVITLPMPMWCWLCTSTVFVMRRVRHMTLPNRLNTLMLLKTR